MNVFHHILILSLTIAATNIFAAGGSPASKAKVVTNSVTTTNATSPMPLSVFEGNLPNGRDPFFPRSQRRAIEAPTATTSTVSTSSLMLQGLSHAAGRPLATINNQTFTPGEDGEVITPGGRLKIHCEQIKADSVIISINGGQRLELRLRQQY